METESVPRVVIAPDKLKGSCTAAAAATAIAAGLRDVWGTRARYLEMPLADGGEGTVQAFLDGGALACARRVSGPYGSVVDAVYAVDGTRAILEMAAASGLLVAGGERAVRRASTAGTGELIRDALDRGATRIVLGIGGSATSDGGAGALAALGVRFLDAAGAELAPHPEALAALDRVDASGLDPRLAGVRLEIACDVTNPLLGANGAAAVYGPQKGASAADVAFLDGVLERFADRAAALTGRDLRAQPGAGAAGGLGWGLATFAGAHLARGFDLVADLRGLADALAGAALCVTAEGRIDGQTLQGKVVAGVARVAAQTGVRVVALAGAVEPAAEEALAAAGVACLPIVAGPLSQGRAMRQAPALIRATARRLARLTGSPA